MNLITIEDLKILWNLRNVQTYKILKKQGWSTKTIVVDKNKKPITETEAKKVYNTKY
jgi:hypothetical protein